MTYLSKLSGEPRPVRRAKVITLLGVVYLLGVAIWWFAWPSAHHL